MYRNKLFFTLAIIHLVVLPYCLGFIVQKYHKLDRYHTVYIEPLYKYNWFEANNECSQIHMSLMMIEDAEKSNALTRLLQRTFGKSRNLWIGGHDLGGEGSFVWDFSGLPFEYTNWAKNPDNFRGGEDCVHIHANYNYKWNDGKCQQKMGFICERVERDETTYDEQNNNE